MKKAGFLLILCLACYLFAERVNMHSVQPIQGKVFLPDLNNQVFVKDYFAQPKTFQQDRDLPTVFAGYPVNYTNSNTFKGAIYTNMDADPELEILWGVGKKVIAHNIDGTPVNGWPVSLTQYIWGSPACGDIDGDGENEIVCTSRNNTNGNAGFLCAFELDGSAVTGFPVTQTGGGTMNACLADLNNDGALEIIVNIRNHPNGWTYVYSGDGTEFPGFPQQLDTFPGAGCSAGDINGDGDNEVVALSYNSLYVFDNQGNTLPGFPLTLTGYTFSYSSPVLVDFDNDGTREVVFGGCSDAGGAVFAINSDGTNRPGFPLLTQSWIYAAVAIGDIDEDGELDLAVGDQVYATDPADYVYAWDKNGNSLTGFPAGPFNAIHTQVGIADLDGDNHVEIMFDDNAFTNGYNCINHDGTICVDWPLPCGAGWDCTTMFSTPVFGDFDNNGTLDIAGANTAFTSYVVECYLWDSGITYNEELAYMIIDGCNIEHNGNYAQQQAIVLNPPDSLIVHMDGIDSITFEIIAPQPGMGTLLGYNIYIDDVLALTIPPDVAIAEVLPGEHNICATAVYVEGESESTPGVVINTLPEPLNLTAEIIDNSTIRLDWDAPVDWDDLLGYNVYLDDELVQFTTEANYDFQINPGRTLYNFSITTAYINGYESDATSIEVAVINTDDIVSTENQLTAYPNPFRYSENNRNTGLNIAYNVVKSGKVEIEVFDIKGRKVSNLLSENREKGKHSLLWNGKDNSSKQVESGIYLIRVKQESLCKTTKTVIIN